MDIGWIGLHEEILNALRVAGADADTDGRFYVRGPIFTGLDPQEALVGDLAQYRCAGEWRPLAALMRETSYGTAVHVIGYDSGDWHSR